MNDKTCYAHYNPQLDKFQTLKEHLLNTAAIASNKGDILPHTVYLAGLFHDCGKISSLWQEYFMKNINGTSGNSGKKEDHTTAGGQLIDELYPDSILSQCVQTAIYSHHGLRDCIDTADGNSLFLGRKRKSGNLPIDECRERFYKQFDKDEILNRSKLAKEEMAVVIRGIKNEINRWKEEGKNTNSYGNKNFFLGMYVRYLTSCLIDADRRDTADFLAGAEVVAPKEDLNGFWIKCLENVEEKLQGFDKKGRMNEYRSRVSNICKDSAKNKANLYRLTLPTGAGKTLASLRFALQHAIEHKKKKIFYIAPYNSIVEQNADSIRSAMKITDKLLEHHCNIVLDTEEERTKHMRLTEDWSAPVIVTTAVQFLNTLFTAKTSNVRRMQSLADSVIIIDEAQAIPIKTIELFNMAINFLTSFMNSTVVLCTATQPLLDQIDKNALLPPTEMVLQEENRAECLRRTEIIDATNLIPGGMNIEQAALFIKEKALKHKKVLFITNTKSCAKKIYNELKDLLDENVSIKHLSTSMCPQHRRNTLNQIKKGLQEDIIQICISTQLIEAGVDISFPCVIRSLAGLDNLIQSAGRCNRNQELERGYVYLVKMAADAENLSHLEEIRASQDAFNLVLDKFRESPEEFDGMLDSPKAVELYFKRYYYDDKQRLKMSYPATIEGVRINLVDLLSSNLAFTTASAQSRQKLKQAFKTAGEEFEAIEEQGDITVIVPYEPYKQEIYSLIKKLNDIHLDIKEKKSLIRKLQPYTVSISKRTRERIGSGIYGVIENQLLLLEEWFYSEEIGVTEEAEPMETLML